MIFLNKKTKQVFVAFENIDFEEFSSYREAIQELINRADNIDERTLLNALQLIEIFTPSVPQQLKGMANEEDYVLVPDRSSSM